MEAGGGGGGAPTDRADINSDISLDESRILAPPSVPVRRDSLLVFCLPRARRSARPVTSSYREFALK